ncbi:MAG TPA: PhzF family phenazine biosynthesis protein [Candidatus Limnocylindria bacterium]|nr:PhzF family phenazine biosynthesis protein [Candidatus Limnocylindria bacterium]
MTRHEYTLVDVFTDRKFGGNQLAVFGDGRGISSETMQAVAKELRIAETTFVVPKEKDGDHKVRIFTPGRELPFAGHPTVGTTWVLSGGRDGTLKLELGVGTLGVTVKSGFVEMEQPLPHFGAIVDDRGAVAASLSLTLDDVVATSPIQQASSGVPFTFVHLRGLDAMKRMQMQRSPVKTALYAFTTETVEPGSTLHARMFAGEALGIEEDPASGGAQGPLAAYCVKYGILRASAEVHTRTEQGFELGRRSILDTRLSMRGAEITAVHVGGNVVNVGGGWMDL